ncbi:plastocyanin/azurin family copper-binding protein [Maribacter chungangensis]|uniref:Plastocyanin/azurin family copper-binding protein n=1 Tax=Maribacter chungangensis TaxID=1069117 RepID=A0ABW3B7H8_9FLAO
MRKLVAVAFLVFGTLVSGNAQDKMAKIVSLEQVPGEFITKQLTLNEGTYIFEITNNAVGHNVGFVLAKKGSDLSNPENHIQTAYVTEQVADGQKQQSSPTTLAKGEYVYFCPLNPTATDNTLTVK